MNPLSKVKAILNYITSRGRTSNIHIHFQRSDQAPRLGGSFADVREYQQRMLQFQRSIERSTDAIQGWTGWVRSMTQFGFSLTETITNVKRETAASCEQKKEQAEKEQAIEQGFAQSPITTITAPQGRQVRLED